MSVIESTIASQSSTQSIILRFNDSSAVFSSGIPPEKLDMVKDFVVDPMHAIFQNTLRRFFMYLRNHRTCRASISEQQFLKIGENWAKNELSAEFTRNAVDFLHFDK